MIINVLKSGSEKEFFQFFLSGNCQICVRQILPPALTLSRLNRAHPKKHDTFVLDFLNDSATIEAAFEPYYRTTILAEETDPNKLHDLKASLDNYQVYNSDQIDELVTLYLDGADRDRLDPILDACVAIYIDSLDEDGQVDFKGKAKAFVRTYGFLASVLPSGNPVWEKLSIFLNFLIPKLPAPKETDLSKGILEAVDMDSYRVEVRAALEISLADQDAEIEPVPTSGGGHLPEPGLLLIKFSGPLPWFNQIAGLLVEVFNASRQLRRRLPEVPSGLEVKSLEEHASYTVPAWESLIAAYLMAGYELSRRNSSTYLATLFPRRVKYILGGDDEEPEAFYLFWPVTHRWGGPNRQRDLLMLDRYGRGDRIEALAGGKEAMRIGVLQFDCLVDFHSVLSFSGQGEPETVNYFDTAYPNVNTTFYPHFTNEHLQLVLPLVDKLWSALQTGGENNYWLFDGGLAKVVAKIDVQRRKTLLARFLVYAEKERGSWMWATQRLPTPTYWRPEELKELIKSLRHNA